MDESLPYQRMPDGYHKSVAWIFDNNVSCIMKNVVDAFVRDGPLLGAAFVVEEKHWH